VTTTVVVVLGALWGGGHPDPQGVPLRNEWVHPRLTPAGLACAEHVVDARQDGVYIVRPK